jgi:hypothetical protein
MIASKYFRMYLSIVHTLAQAIAYYEVINTPASILLAALESVAPQ